MQTLLDSSSFLTLLLGALQFGILITPFISKGKLYDRTPANLLNGKTSILKRAKGGLYVIIALSIISIVVLIRKDFVDNKNKGDIIEAINNQGFAYNEKNKHLVALFSSKLNGLVKLYDRPLLSKKQFAKMGPRLSMNAYLPFFQDTIRNKLGEFKVIFPVFNVGTGSAHSINFTVAIFSPLSGQIKLTKTNLGELEVNRSVAQRIAITFPNTLKEFDTVYCITQFSYTDSIGRKYNNKRMYNCYTLGDGLKWPGITNPTTIKKLDKIKL
jgi:hypothetical protein